MPKKFFYVGMGVLALSLAYLVAAPSTEGQFIARQTREVSFPAVPREYGEIFQVHEWTEGDTYDFDGATYYEYYRAVWFRDGAGTVRRSVFQHDMTLDRDKSRASMWNVVEVYPRK